MNDRENTNGLGSTDDLSPIERLKDETEFRCKVIAALQICGGAAALLARHVYNAPMPHDRIVFLLIYLELAAAFAFLFAALNGFRSRVFPFRRLNQNALEIDDYVTFISTSLLVVDAALCALLVSITGGARSVFAPLLFAILGVSVTLRLPYRSLLTSLVASFVALAAALFLPEWPGQLSNATVSASRPASAVVYQPGNVESALWISRGATLLLTLLGAAQWLRDPLPERTIDQVFDNLGEELADPSDHRRAIEAGMKDFIRGVGRRVALCTLSHVHDLKTIIEQAVILNVAYTGKHVAQTRRQVVYLTFIAHWIDDLFDFLFHGMDSLGNTTSVDDLCRRSRSFRMVYRRMYRHMNLRNDQRRREAIDRGIRRIFLAAMMQRCRVSGSLKPIVEEYVKVVTSTDGLKEEIRGIYQKLESDPTKWVIIWGTAKVVSEIFDCNSVNFDANSSEMYSILGAPVLILQNSRVEDEKEEISKHFRSRVFDPKAWQGPLDDQKTILNECVELFRSHVHIIKGETRDQLSCRRAQLRALLAAYGRHLPSSLRSAYEELAKDEIWTTASPMINDALISAESKSAIRD